MTQVIAISGKKSSGKTTVARYLMGRKLKAVGSVLDFSVDSEGTLHLKVPGENGESISGPVDFTRSDQEFVTNLIENVWPHARISPLAEFLKYFCVDVMNIDPHKIYGRDDQKNELTQYKWSDLPPPVKKSSAINSLSDKVLKELKTSDGWPSWIKNVESNDQFLSGREFMKYWGEDIFRAIDEKFHFKKWFEILSHWKPAEAYVDDVRHVSDLEEMVSRGAKVIRLTKDVDDVHSSETQLDNYDFSKFGDNFVEIPCADKLQDKLNAVEEALQKWNI